MDGASTSDSRTQRLQAILVSIVEANEAGRPIDSAELRQRYPEFADELADFVAGRARLDELALPLRQAAGAATIAHGSARQVDRPRLRYIGDYELLEEIARGGMGVVYRARQASLQREVAVKMILAGHLATDVDRQRFRQEAEAAASLDHPGIVPIYEIGEHEGQHYFSMKLVAGGSLAEAIADCRLQIADWQRAAARLLAQVARAVHYAHQRGILHRDLKPANILLQSAICNLQSAIPLVTDFGLAKRLEAGSAQSGIVGTAAYMAPEQARGEKRLSTAVDVYSLGAILYELLTGRPPFQAETPVATVVQLLEQAPQRLRSIDPDIDRDLETICLKCLEKEPGSRYGSAEALADDLERWVRDEPIQARPCSPLERLAKWSRRRPALVGLLGLGLVFLVFTIALSIIISQQRAELRTRHAELEARRMSMLADKAEAELTRLRLGQSRIGEARAERLAGNRSGALELLVQARDAGIMPELQAEAIQTILSPGVRLLHEIPVGYANSMQFSPDGRLLAVHGVFGIGPGWRAGDPDPHQTQRLKVWRMPAGELLGDTHLSAVTGGLGVGQSNYGPTQFTSYNRYLFSPIGPLLALPDSGGKGIRLWDAATDKNVAQLAAAPWYLAFSPDGKRLAAPSPGALQIWDLDAREPGRLRLPDGVPAVWRSNDELISRFHDDKDYRFRCIEVTAGRELTTTPPGMSVLSLSDNGTLAAIHAHQAKAGAPVTIWDLVAGQELATIPDAVPVGHSPYGARFSPDGSYFAIDDPVRPNTFVLWHRETGRRQELLRGAIYGGGQFNQFQRAAFSPDGALLVHYAQKGRSVLHLWDVRGERRVAVLRDAHTPVWSGDGRLLATLGRASSRDGGTSNDRAAVVPVGSEDRAAVHVWEVIYPPPALPLRLPVETLQVQGDGKRLIANNRVVRLEPGPSLRAEPAHTGASVLLQADRELWAVNIPDSPTADRPIQLQRLEPPGHELVLKMPSIPRERNDQKDSELIALPLKNRCAIDRAGRRLFAICQIHQVTKGGGGFWSDKRVLVAWDTATGDVRALSSGRHALECLALNPDETMLATGTGGGAAFWDTATLQHLRSLENTLTTSAELSNWTSCGSSGPGSPYTYIFRTHCVRFSPDGTRLYGASASGRLDMYSIPSMTHAWSMEGHRGGVLAVAVTPDGKRLVSGGEDRTIRLWEADRGQELWHWQAHDESVAALAFVSGGDTLASGGGDGVLKLWDLAFIEGELKGLGLGPESPVAGPRGR